MSKRQTMHIFLSPRQAATPAPSGTALLVQQAMLLHQQGRIPEAAAIYTAVLRTSPAQVDCLHYLGVARYQAGQHEEAVELIRKALALNGTQATAWSNLGLALHRLGKLQEAIDSYDKALSLNPRLADALGNRGNLLRDLGRPEDALRDYDAAVAHQPNHLDTLANRAALLRQLGRPAEALACCDKLLALNPSPAAHNMRGMIMRDLKRFDEALASFDRAITVKPDFIDAIGNKANILYEMGDHRAACEAFDQAVAIAPASAAIRLKRLMARIPAVAEHGDDIAAIRAGLAGEIAALRKWLEENPDQNALDIVGAAQPFFLAYHEHSNRDLIAPYGEMCSRLMARWSAQQGIRAAAARDIAGTKIRVGIVSAHIADHPVWTAIVRGWFQQLDPDRFELHVFYPGTEDNAQTEFARSRAASFHRGPKSTPEWARLIVSARSDLLIYPELGMDALTPQLAALRLAPIQIAAWGHPETTGLPTVDYYLSADLFEDAGTDACYTERLIRLPNLGCYYEPEAVEAADVDLAQIGVRVGSPLLVCPGSPFKYAPEHDRTIVEIARRLGDAQFLFFTNPAAPGLSAKFLRRLSAAFRDAGLEPQRYLVHTPWHPRPGFYGIMRRADVFLDTIGFSGFNTAMQAIDCALPVVTVKGRFMRGRFAAAILARIGLDGLVHDSAAGYIDAAVRLASDAQYRDKVRSALIAGREILYKDAAPIRALEQVLAELCAGQGAEGSSPTPAFLPA